MSLEGIYVHELIAVKILPTSGEDPPFSTGCCGARRASLLLLVDAYIRSRCLWTERHFDEYTRFCQGHRSALQKWIAGPTRPPRGTTLDPSGGSDVFIQAEGLTLFNVVQPFLVCLQCLSWAFFAFLGLGWPLYRHFTKRENIIIHYGNSTCLMLR